jgi:FMN-dependent oxidoreductase (nitrilotriacetate monooxygenase family)
MTRPRKQVALAAHFPGVNNTTIWSTPESGSQIDFSSFEHFARTAERGLFDYLFLAEGLRLREHKGEVYELDVLGRPNTLAVLASLAAVTEHIGLIGTLSATFNEPYELARQLATLDHLSNGRAGWNIVTTSDAFHGENFRRGAFLNHADRYVRAGEFLDVAADIWDGWDPDTVLADATDGRFVDAAGIHEIDHHGPQFDVVGYPTLPRSRQGRPVIVQAGDSPAGRDFAASRAEVIFSRHTAFEEARIFYEDVQQRLAAAGRERGSLKILPAATFILGDTQRDAEENAREVARLQITPQTAIAFLERVWGRDLSDWDPDGPLPDIEPDAGDGISKGRVPTGQDPTALVRTWREKADAEGLSIRELVLQVAPRESFVGTPGSVADEIDRYVQQDASDGFVIVGNTTPGGLDEFVEKVIPELQERGSYRSEYPKDATLRALLFAS